MGLFGSSSKKTTENYDQSINLQNGGTVLGNGARQTVSNVTTDHKSVAAAMDVSEDALFEMSRVSRDANKSVTTAARDATKAVVTTARDSLNFGEDALFEVGRSTQNAVDQVASIGRDLVEFGKRSLEAVADGNSKALQSVSASNAASMGAVKGMAENLNAGVTSETSGTDKTIIYVAGAFALAMLLMVVVMGFRK